jgi:uncharacterized membrane protein YkoI
MKKLALYAALAAFAAAAPAAFVSTTFAPAAFAKDDRDHDREDQLAASAALARGEILPISKILEIATAAVPGDVLKVKLEREKSGFEYEVKILARNGRVREIELDARNGKVLSIEDD